MNIKDLIKMHILYFCKDLRNTTKYIIPFLALIYLLSGCKNTDKQPHPDLLMKVPVALINNQNKYLSITPDTSFLFSNRFDSSCLFHIVSLNEGMKALLRTHVGGYLSFSEQREEFGLSKFEKASVLAIQDKGGSFLSFQINGRFLCFESKEATLEQESSSKNLFFAIYDPLFRHDKYIRGQSIKDYETQLMSKVSLKDQIMQKAKKRNIPYADMVLLDAIWLYRNGSGFDFRSQRILHHFTSIRNSKKYMEMIREKAKKRGLSEVRMAWLDAKHIFDQEMKTNATSP